MTSLEIILEKHNVTKYKFLKVMGVDFNDNSHKRWYHKLAGKRKITPMEFDLINETLAKFKIKDRVDYAIDRYVIV